MQNPDACFVLPVWLCAGVQGVPDGGVRITSEDKPLLSDMLI
jgi:hypothetical protein